MAPSSSGQALSAAKDLLPVLSLRSSG